MALSSSGLAGLVLADYFAVFPTAAAVLRENTTTGVLPHNPPTEMITAICTGVVDALKMMLVRDNYTGVAGTTAYAQMTPPIFNPGIITAQSVSLMSTLGWVGGSATPLVDVLINSLFQAITATGSIKMPPLVGGGTGVGLVTPSVNPSLAAAMTAACQSTLVSAFTATGYFAIDDIPGGGLTPQMAAMITGLSSAYGSVVGSVTASVTYTGGSSGSALTFVNSGTFV